VAVVCPVWRGDPEAASAQRAFIDYCFRSLNCNTCNTNRLLSLIANCAGLYWRAGAAFLQFRCFEIQRIGVVVVSVETRLSDDDQVRATV
jgi:hypothetical protein